MTKEILLDTILSKSFGEIELYECYEAMEEYAKQESIEFIKWYINKTIVFVHYLSEIKPLVRSDEIEEKLNEFEGTTFEGLFTLYLKSKQP